MDDEKQKLTANPRQEALFWYGRTGITLVENCEMSFQVNIFV